MRSALAAVLLACLIGSCGGPTRSRTIEHVDAPQICGGSPQDIAFPHGAVGAVAHASVVVANCGVSVVEISSLQLCSFDALTRAQDAPCNAPDPAFAVASPPIASMAPGANVTIDATYVPPDNARHIVDLIVHSNAQDLVFHLSGESTCAPTTPQACAQLLDDPATLFPFGVAHLDASCSSAAGSSAVITQYAWSVVARPEGSTATLQNDGTSADTSIIIDVAGQWCLGVDVVDSAGSRSCSPATTCFDAEPTQDLFAELTWDSPAADLDLHLMATGGTPFTGEQDCFFANRAPTPDACVDPATTCAWVADAAANPVLGHDDNHGFGPEQTSIVHPAAGSHWTLLVHYWNAQTDGDPRTTATVRVFVRGVQSLELDNTFDGDQQMWSVVDITWPDGANQPTFLPLATTAPFPRPF